MELVGSFKDAGTPRTLDHLQQRLELAIRGSGFGVWEYDLESNLLIWDGRMFDLYGHTAATFQGNVDQWRDLIVPEDQPSVDLRFADLMAGRSVMQLEFRIRRADTGELRWIEGNGYLQRTEEGQPHRLVGMNRDITEAKRSIEQLRLLETCVAHLKDMVLITDAAEVEIPGPRIVFVNQALVQHSGYTREELIGRTPRIFQGPLTDPAELARIKDALRNSEPIRVELANYSKAGVLYWVEIEIVPVFGKDGRPSNFIAVQRDVTERKEAEAALLESEERYRVLVESQQELFCRWLPDTTLTFVNRSYARFFNKEPAELIGTRFLDYVLPADREALLASVDHMLATGESVSSVQATPRHDGVLRWHQWKDSPLPEQPGRPRELVSLGIDITERRLAEEARDAMQAKLLQSRKLESLGRFAGGVAHAVNNMHAKKSKHPDHPLGQVEPTDPMHEDLAQISAAAERSAAMTRQLLAFARQQPPKSRLIEVNAAISATLRLLEDLVGERARLCAELTPGAWKVLLDPVALDQVLTNLVVNARDAMKKQGTITVRTTNRSFTAAGASAPPAGDYVEVSVTDNGEGIPPEVLHQIFEPFFTTKEFGKGTGLGLATVHGIVTQNGGTIQVESTPGEGSCFRVFFPRAEEETGAPLLATEAATRGAQRGTILLVDDEPALLDSFRRVLTGEGYEVLTARSAIEAEAFARNDSKSLHLLLTDVRMPGIGGMELHRHMRAVRPHLPTIFMSGYSPRELDLIEAPQRGVFFLQKPVGMAELRAKVLEAMGCTAPPRSDVIPGDPG